MFRKVIVPPDRSVQAERALLYAVQLAAASGGSAALVRTVPDSVPEYLTAIRNAETYLPSVADGYPHR